MRDAAVIALVLLTTGLYYLLKGDSAGAVSLAVVFLGAICPEPETAGWSAPALRFHRFLRWLCCGDNHRG